MTTTGQYLHHQHKEMFFICENHAEHCWNCLIAHTYTGIQRIHCAWYFRTKINSSHQNFNSFAICRIGLRLRLIVHGRLSAFITRLKMAKWIIEWVAGLVMDPSIF